MTTAYLVCIGMGLSGILRDGTTLVVIIPIPIAKSVGSLLIAGDEKNSDIGLDMGTDRTPTHFRTGGNRARDFHRILDNLILKIYGAMETPNRLLRFPILGFPFLHFMFISPFIKSSKVGNY